jgi:DNA (cytosine-5)-methyltransferase 1
VAGGKYKVLSLFAGIGGFDLGLERTGGFETVAFCEIDKKAQAVLRKHWPEVPVYGDVRQLTADRLRADGIVPDVIVGGFPCQDISLAGRGAGIDGERSGLWGEYSRLVREIRPRFVIVENVSALLGRGLDRVLRDLAESGYDAEWECLGAYHVGAPHIRDRLWLIAYPGSEQHEGESASIEWARAQGFSCADTRLRRHWMASGQVSPRRHGPVYGNGWAAEPALDRVAYGVPGRVDRLKQLGNAVVPQIPELIGRAILAAESLAA